MNDFEAFEKYPEYRHLYNKLHLSMLQNIPCGTDSRDIPKSGWYIFRPIVNLEGMALGMEKHKVIGHDVQHAQLNMLKPGHFWQEKLKGRHLSFDFKKGNQILCVEKCEIEYRTAWKKTQDKFEMGMRHPEINKAILNAPECNIEMIGDKIIEMHFRLNPDFVGHDSNYVVPVGEQFQQVIKHGETFFFNPDYGRKGFLIKGNILLDKDQDK